MKPYVGITDFAAKEQVETMLAVFTEAFPLGNRNLMVGTMMSYKTLNNLPTKWAGIFPSTSDQFRDIYPSCRDLLLNTLHYADYDGITTKDDLSRAIMIVGHRGPFSPPAIDALQLDMIWPSEQIIWHGISKANSLIEESTKDDNPLRDLKVILQVGSKAMEVLDNDPKKIAAKIAWYGKVIHCVLFDRSGGLGKKMDADLLRSYIAETKAVCPNISIAVAGGLGPDTMDLIVPLVAEFPDISIDAQGKLRRSGSALDPIDWDLAEKYLMEAGKVLG
jgi:hypothetical protein